MRSSTAVARLVVLGAVASQVAAGVIEARAEFKHLFSRQTNACTATCSPFQNALDICETTSCLCTRAVAVALNDCVNCYYEQSPSTAIVQTANELIDKYEKDTCSAFTDLPSATLTGASGGSTTAISGSSGASVTVSGTTSTPAITTRSTVTSLTDVGATTIGAPQTVVRPASTTTSSTESAGSTDAGSSSGGILGGNGALSVGRGRWEVAAAVAVVGVVLVL